MGNPLICPAMTNGDEEIFCKGEGCAWYCSEMEMCSVLAIPSQLQTLVEHFSEEPPQTGF